MYEKLSKLIVILITAGCSLDEKPIPVTAIPTSREGHVFSNGKTWDEYVDEFHKIASKNEAIDMLWLGDSITEFWQHNEGINVYDKFFGEYKSYNFGIRGDCTQHLLWRVKNGGLGKLKPKIIFLLIGANNWQNTANEVAKGILTIVKEIHFQKPKSKLILFGVFPQKEKKDNSTREKIKQINSILNNYIQENTFYYDIGNAFVDEKGVILENIMPDFLHLSCEGYHIWANKIKEIVKTNNFFE